MRSELDRRLPNVPLGWSLFLCLHCCAVLLIFV